MSPAGHFAMGLGAKHFAPNVKWYILLIASYWLDIMFFLFAVLGIEKMEYSPYSHSLIFALLWSALWFISSWLMLKEIKVSVVLFFIVLSHWLLDIIAWDFMPVLLDSHKKIGLGIFTRLSFNPGKFEMGKGVIYCALIEWSLLIPAIFIFRRVSLKKKIKEKNNEV
ncbi:MAG: hypothetical protein KAR21_06535 [Spirochaetales bacterium]|nr:hypothetical protein [Spirochaetales bacterium]